MTMKLTCYIGWCQTIDRIIFFLRDGCHISGEFPSDREQPTGSKSKRLGHRPAHPIQTTLCTEIQWDQTM